MLIVIELIIREQKIKKSNLKKSNWRSIVDFAESMCFIGNLKNNNWKYVGFRPVALMARAAVSKAACCGFESYQACWILYMFGKIKKFVEEVVVELKKVSWSTRKEVIDATWIILISSVCLGLFIGGTDFVLSKFLEIIIR